MQIKIKFKPIELNLDRYDEVNYRSKSEASTYCKKESCYINGVLHHRSFWGSDWIQSHLQRITFGMNLVRRAKKQDIVVP